MRAAGHLSFVTIIINQLTPTSCSSRLACCSLAMARIKSRGRPRANGAPLQWTDDMTHALFQYRYGAPAYLTSRGLIIPNANREVVETSSYDTFAAAFADPAQRRRAGGSWREVAARLGEAFGVEVDVDQCRNKARSFAGEQARRSPHDLS